ncbi:G-type lectin S-receptor-like serine/threonine-protein kinase RLK1 [Pyrus ussuriensis x Pyrus communis]|uniref:Receptor-like serine/threonine-protein kinase n=1 Tax=Pyrus ussuriensis x Pyrus communis TaxID=2448454 RepID=A0A5N5FW73_9ROSA|nr:G-type lectin S-receptor-like serine/threonine-protein kinase LECRK3 [Pyrus x bretschneideri]KAB2607386.1 G-type lectin S-receptor-like serine/threonine-protein kinase RLK1 [Pyrus ussuriensis x Pyrus communis]
MAMAFSVRMLLFSSLFLLPIYVFSQNNGRVAVGSSLTATTGNSSSWLSPSGDFAFGFSPLGSDDLFLLSIRYAKIPDETVVWYAYDGNNPMVAPRGSVLNLTANNGLVLNNPQGGEIWKSQTTFGIVENGVMNDTGNFVLQDQNSGSLWETFSNPTDTVLPGQTIEKNGKLSCRQSESNYAKGRFQLRLQDDGNLVLNTVNLPTDYANNPYFATGTTAGTVEGSQGKQLVFNSSGDMFVLRENGGRFTLTGTQGVSVRDNYVRATLDFDGIFALYSHPKNFTGNASWSNPLWYTPDDICQTLREDMGVGVCGYNSVCKLKTDNRPTCECPEGFSFLDPNDIYRGCKPDFIQGCEEDELQGPRKDLYDVKVLTNTDWPTSDYVQLKPFSADKCNESCFQDCLCAVAVFRSETCWKKKLPLSNGRVDVSLNSQTFIKVRKDNATLQSLPKPIPDDKEKRRKSVIRVESVLLGTSIFVNFVLSSALCLGFFFIFRKKPVRPSTDIVLDSNLRSFSYEELREATNAFNEELGRGAFGVVFKGVMQIGSGVEVAVKKLNYVMQDVEKEFKTELKVIGQTHHKNLVRLFGYCDEGQQRLLVYEFLRNGTLASFLFSDIKPSWRQRIEIAYGVAQGLLYLHEECGTQIIHCDIKPQNILLDDYYTARISDFGLAKLLLMNQSQTHTAIRGTKGYVAPEWFRNLPITTKVDVYSFGVVLLEIICCRRSVDMEGNCEERAILTYWVYDCYVDGGLDAVVDCEVEALGDRTTLEKFVMVAIWCIQEDPSLRPTMKKVVQMLEGVVEVPVPPCPSPYTR